MPYSVLYIVVNNYLQITLCNTEQSDSNPIQFVQTPGESIEAEIYTPITLFWQIRYESCSDNRNCFNNDWYFNDTNNNEINPLDGRFLFDSNTTLIKRDGAYTYANMRVVMFIDDYIYYNITSIACRACVSRSNFTVTDCATNAVRIGQPLSTTTLTSNEPTNTASESATPRYAPVQECPTSMAMVLQASMTLVVSSPALALMLLGFIQLLLPIASLIYC